MRFLKVGAIVFGALLITTLGISATDVLTGSSGSLLGQLVATNTQDVCPQDMVHVPTAQTFTCVDRYEASAAVACPVQQPKAGAETQQNLNEVSCASTAVAGATPWTYVSREQAATLCARAGKRLPTAAEWYFFAIGTPDTGSTCNISTAGPWLSGTGEQCVAATGVYDAVGNVWEWVSDDVREAAISGVALPSEGYVAQVDSAGIPSLTDSQPSEQFGADYFWSNAAGAFGMLRGGFYGNRTDAGVYAIQAKTVPTVATVAIGFRCVR